MQKKIIHETIIKKNIERYIKRQQRIKSLKAPIFKVRNVLQGIVGDSIEELHDEEHIDTSSQDVAHELAKTVLENLNLPESVSYFHEVLKKNLNKTNKKWAQLIVNTK